MSSYFEHFLPFFDCFKLFHIEKSSQNIRRMNLVVNPTFFVRFQKEFNFSENLKSSRMIWKNFKIRKKKFTSTKFKFIHHLFILSFQQKKHHKHSQQQTKKQQKKIIMGKNPEKIFYQFIFCIKSLLMQQADVTIQLSRKMTTSISPITIRKIRAIRGCKHFNKTSELHEQYGDIISMFQLANYFIYTKGAIYRYPTILCMETQYGHILTEKEIIEEGKSFYEQTLLQIISTMKGTQKVKLHKEADNVQFEVVE